MNKIEVTEIGEHLHEHEKTRCRRGVQEFGEISVYMYINFNSQ